jgi:hypothetical protein
MDNTPVLTMTVYILASVVMAVVITAMVLWHRRLQDRKRSHELLHRDPVSKEEGIAVALDDFHHQHAHHTHHHA